MKVAIWGSYGYGNYGDELMGIQFAVFLKRLGAKPMVFGLPESLARNYGIETASSADELVQDASFCVFGGGSLLSANKTGTGPYARQKAQEYNDFTLSLEKHECPLYLLSIGGDGAFGDGTGIAPFRERLLRSKQCKMATVRQAEDVAVIQNRFGIEARYYPDILLNVPTFWGIDAPARAEQPIHVGLNLPLSHRQAMRVLTQIARFRSDVVYHFIRTVRHAPGQQDNLSQEYVPQARNSHIQVHVYDDPVQTLHFLSSLDVVITHKLHIGLTALAFGCPYLCTGKILKGKAFLTSIGAKDAFWGDTARLKQEWQILHTLLSSRKLRSLGGLFDQKALEAQKRESFGHYHELRSIYERYQSASDKPAPFAGSDVSELMA